MIAVLAAGCSGPKPDEAAKSTPVIKIDRLEPSSTGITRPFNVRADGQAALTKS
jgi:hypothetical protein